MASEVNICNLALMKFGDVAITSLDDGAKESRACKVFYPLMRDELLYAHPWNFAMTRADITAAVDPAPGFQFDYAYQLPADCLRVWELYGSDAEWVAENGQLLVNQSESIYIRYIRRVTESGRFNPAFIECLATRLAAELSTKLSTDKSLRASLLEELYNVHLPHALSLNAMEGNKPRHKNEQGLDKGHSSWQTVGR